MTAAENSNRFTLAETATVCELRTTINGVVFVGKLRESMKLEAGVNYEALMDLETGAVVIRPVAEMKS